MKTCDGCGEREEHIPEGGLCHNCLCGMVLQLLEDHTPDVADQLEALAAAMDFLKPGLYRHLKGEL